MPNEQYAIKGLSQNRFGGYTAVWGNPKQLDLQGDYFTRETDFALEAYPTRPLIHHHGQTAAMGRTIIGTIDSWKKDDIGLWCEGEFKRLDDDTDLFDEEERKLREEYIEIIKEKIAAGELNFSSGALGHLVKRLDDGFLSEWFWCESSDTGSPAEPRRTEIELMKAIKGMDSFLTEGATPGQTTQPETEESQHETKTEVQLPKGIADANEPDELTDRSHDKGVSAMTPEDFLAMFGEFPPDVQQQLLATLREMLGEVAEEETAAAKPEDEEEEEKQGEEDEEEEEKQGEEEDEDERLEKAIQRPASVPKFFTVVQPAQNTRDSLSSQIKDLKKKAKPAPGSGGKFLPAAKANRQPRFVGRSRYEEAGWQPEDYAFYITAKRALNPNFQPTNEFAREATEKLIKARDEIGLTTKSLDQLVQLQSYAKANELEHSTQTGFGDEWVQDGWATTIIQKARNENRILSLFNSVPMPSDPFNMPTEGTDPVVMAGAETTDASQLVHNNSNVTPFSKIGTGKVILASGMLKSRVGISEVELEDAHVNVLQQKRKQLQRALADAMDAVLLNADPGATGNINYNGGTIDSTDATDVNGKFLYGGGQGLNRVPLKTAPTTLLLNMGGIPTLNAMWSLIALLNEAYMEDQDNLAYIVDTRTGLALKNIPEFLTVDKYGSNATVLTGEVGKIGAIPVVHSSKMKLANDDGTVSSTASLNKKGRALLIYRPTNYIGYRRNPNVWNVTDPDFGATILGVSVRMATQRFDNEGIAMLKNITV